MLEVENVALTLAVTRMQVEEFSVGIALLQKMDPRALEGNGLREGRKAERSTLENTSHVKFMDRQFPKLLCCIKLSNQFMDHEELHPHAAYVSHAPALQLGYINNDDCPRVLIKKSNDGFCIISVYVDDLNIIETTRDIEEAMAYLKAEFEMKDLDKTKFCLGL